MSFLSKYWYQIKYRNHLLKKYWKQTPFAYVKTYSGFRREEFENTPLKRRITGNDRIIDLKGKMHSSTIETAIIQQGDQRIKTLKDIFHLPLKEFPVAPCIPKYRDAIAFYSETDEIVNILHICFQCMNITDEQHNYYYADYNIYAQLGGFLRD